MVGGCMKPSRRGFSPGVVQSHRLHFDLAAMKTVFVILGATALVFAAVAPAVWADRTSLKSGVNIFSPEQDIELGKQNAAQAEQQLRMLKDPKVDNYLNDLGKKLATRPPGYKNPYQYKGVNDTPNNPFPFPGRYN